MFVDAHEAAHTCCQTTPYCSNMYGQKTFSDRLMYDRKQMKFTVFSES